MADKFSLSAIFLASITPVMQWINVTFLAHDLSGRDHESDSRAGN